jgi:hypothetical protein
LCRACVRFDGRDACTSFPDGIPEPIVAYAHDHHFSIRGEAPFELDETKHEEYLQWERWYSNVQRRAA